MLYNSARNAKERTFRLLRMHANSSQEVQELRAGDIGVIVGMKNAYTGDTLCQENSKVLLEKPVFPQPVISVAIECKSSVDSDKLKNALAILSHEDPTFLYKENEETGQIIISGMGELHLDVLVRRLRDEYKVDSNEGNPQVTYRESISSAGEDEAVFEKVINGKNVYAAVRLSLSVDKNDFGYGTGSVTYDKSLLKKCGEEFVTAAFEQVKASLCGGIVSGYECTGINAVIKGISFNDDTQAFAVASAAAICFDNLARKLSPVLLEPVMNVVITTPPEFVGDCISTLTSRSGMVESMESKGADSLIIATAPLKSLFGFTTALRSSSQGKANFSMEFRCYDIKTN